MAQHVSALPPTDIVARHRHLGPLLRSHNQSTSISHYEHTQGGVLLATSHVNLDFAAHDPALVVQDLLVPSHPLCHTHMLVVEDVPSDLIAAFESTLNLDPEFFAAHLTNCGWRDPQMAEHYPAFEEQEHHSAFEDSEYSTWWTRRFKKQFFSIKWYRPYAVSLGSAPSSAESAPFSLGVSPTRLILGPKAEYFRRSSNFRRAFLDLRTINSVWDYSRATASNLQSGNQLVAEERLSIWRGRYRHHEISELPALPELSPSWASWSIVPRVQRANYFSSLGPSGPRIRQDFEQAR